jgi:RNA polymerase sigma-70 factor (family 1)
LALRPVHNEKELLQAVAKGNKKAFEELFYAYHNQLGEYVQLLIASEDIAQEIVQDIFVKIWMSRDNLDTLGNFSSWLFILTRNHTLNCIRRQCSERKKKEAFELYAIVDDSGEDSPPIPSDYEHLIGRAVAQLPPQQQKVFTLKQAGHKNNEIAAQLGISPESVKKYQQWALKSVTDFIKTHAELSAVLIAITLLKK